MILAIDDDLDVLRSIDRCLSHSGYRVVTTDDAADAFSILARDPIRVLISDIDMPAMNGLELIRRTRHLHPHIARILLSGFGTFDAAQRAINEGEVHRFLCKPFDPAELAHVVGDALERTELLSRARDIAEKTNRRRQLLDDLENEHPGITPVDRAPDGAYLLDNGRVLIGKALLGVSVATWANDHES